MIQADVLADGNDVGMSGLLPTGTVTLLLADVESSTRLWETRPDEMTASFAQLDAALTALIAEHDGARPVEQGEGDSFVLAFARASDAVACALALQRIALGPIRLRIGVHTGEVQLRDEGNYIGPAINRAARLRDLAHGGQTVLSGTTEGLVADMLPPDSWLLDLGGHELRGVSRPERVVQLCHPELCNEHPPLRATEGRAAGGLPAQLTSFVGRVTEIDEVRGILAINRLVTLAGAGGAGKTRLAIEVASRVAESEAPGYVDLAPITNPDLVPVALGRVLGLPDQPGRSMIDAIIQTVAGRQMLIVLDNCEHLLDACAELVVAVLERCPRLRLLATSREPIGVPGEAVWKVPSLSLADEAIELFADRARRARSDFAVTDANVELVTEICRRLDGMPLAIELAAARVRALSLAEIAGSLHDRFRLLTGGSRTLVRRQQTLRASVDWSHALLTEPERTLFRRLSAFVGGFDLDAAQAVAADGDVERYQVFDQLTLLVDKSLVISETTSGTTRFRFLETVRQYALEKLGDSGEADTVRTRHRDHYAALAAVLDAPAHTGHTNLVEQAETEIDNLRAALAWCRESGDTEALLRLASSLQPLWLARGHVVEGMTWLESGLREPSAQQVTPTARALALATKVTLLGWTGTAGSVEEAEQALAIARDADEPALLARALLARGSASLADPEMSKAYFDKAADAAREHGDPWLLCQSLSRLANIAVIRGDSAGWAHAATLEGLQAAQLIGDRFTSRFLRWVLAYMHTIRGELVEALAGLREVTAESTAEHDALFRLYGLVMQGNVLAFHGEASAARDAAEEALRDCAELIESYEPACYAAVGVTHLAGNDIAAALRANEAAWQRRDENPAMSGMYVWSPLAPLASGDLVTARAWADDAVELARGWFRASAMAARGRVELAQGQHDEAERDVHEALGIVAETGGRLVVPDLLECLAYLASNADDDREAARLLGAVDAIRQRMGAVRFKVLDPAHQAVVDKLRDALGGDEFDTARTEGSAMSTDEAIAYAQRGRGQRRRPATGWASLTPTERDVVRLVAEGLSNKEIGARLFISPRTVETHLTHVYAKLDVSSRVQLAQQAAGRADPQR
ncbi:helix-turn-helix transcriptional regulator [[Mycobacterium] zoologicum]|uniref:helix-turn-helix transcriptional regulator n=1 Tax=[Mycobacterium] zoologicum TaxID=2872311 RepID=UPI002CED9BD4|nr:LuxR C-terminal-related transcriptional regulator [Mycolicibacter sp. MYC101]MEB3062019.1 LuxR C-terminal-related transcriptional regulator [Mycolicibacter sp. MYC101]